MSENIKVVILDDEEVSRNATYNILKNYDNIEIVASVDSSVKLISVLKKQDIDLLFLDIEMPDNTGFEVANFVNKNFNTVSFIFLTGHSGFALDCYDFEPVDFLTKPVNIFRLERALQRAEKTIAVKKGYKLTGRRKTDTQTYTNSKIGINVETGYQLISIESIKYIEKKGRKVYILTDTQELSTKYSLQQLESMFMGYNFYRCHQSFIVPVNKITSVENSVFGNSHVIGLKDCSQKVPLSRNKFTELKELLKNKGISFC